MSLSHTMKAMVTPGYDVLYQTVPREGQPAFTCKAPAGSIAVGP